jgi:transposase
MLTALRYGLRSGGAWHLLPHDFPPWKTVSHAWRTWRWSGEWERLHTLRRQRSRQRRLSTDSAYLPTTAECAIYLAMLRLRLRRRAET